MPSASRPAGRALARALWAALSALAVLLAAGPAARPPARFSCDALTPPPTPGGSSAPRRRSSSATQPADNAALNGVVDPDPEGRIVADGPLRPGAPPLTPAADADPNGCGDDARSRFSDAFFQCYDDAKRRDEEGASALSCVGEGARVGLQSFFTRRDLHISEGLSLVKEEPRHEVDGAAASEARETPLPFPQQDINPSPLFEGHYRAVIDNAAAYLSARALRWDMSGLYPGLVMRVGPTLSGNGWLEFVLEPRRIYSDRQLGPSRMVLKQVILPFLLGVKVSVHSLVPLLLFAIVFLAKKALLMSQLSTLASGLLGFGAFGAFGGQAYGHPHAFANEGLGAAGLAGGPLHNSLLPLRTSPQVFPNAHRQPAAVEEGPHILHLAGGPFAAGNLPGTMAASLSGLAPSWLSGTHHHLFRKVNYDFRDERHAAAASAVASASTTSSRNNKGFRWEDEVRGGGGDPDPRDTAADGVSNSRSSHGVWGSYSLG